MRQYTRHVLLITLAVLLSATLTAFSKGAGSAPEKTRGTVKALTTVSEASDFRLPWYVFGNGGIINGASSGNTLAGTVGQPVVDRGTSPGNTVDIGFWYGADGCSCRYQGDLDQNGAHDAVDLSYIIDAVFFGGDSPSDAHCPALRADTNCDGTPDAVDLSYEIDLVFFGGAPPCNPCL